jgi:hypothetical protein
MAISFHELERTRFASVDSGALETGFRASCLLATKRGSSQDWFWHSWFLTQSGRWPGAAKAIRRAIDRDPSNEEALGFRGWIDEQIAIRKAAGLPLDLVAESDHTRRTWRTNLMHGYNGVVDSHLLQDPEAWRELCRERGYNPGMFSANEWVRICTARGYSLRRHNSRGF